MKETDIKSQITVFCKDSCTRVINCWGAYNQSSAAKLGQDLEGQNYLSVSVVIN